MMNTRSYSYILSLFPGLIALFGNIMGGYYTFIAPIYALGFLVIADWIFPVNKENTESQTSAFFADSILFLASILHYAVVVSLLLFVRSNPDTPELLFAILGSGLNAGISGITVAHELIHRKSKAWQAMGILNLLFVAYGHFYVEHIKGHHKNVGTSKDAATARRNEPLYLFLLRTIPGQWWSAFQIEMEKHSDTHFILSIVKNKVFWFTLFIPIVFIALYMMHPTLAYAWIAQCGIAIFLLEYVNYIEHYGLTRGEQQRYSEADAWQSDSISSRFTLIDLSRHSDHHLRAYKPYQDLNSLEGSPVLPGGYFGVFYICLIPPLWFKMMNPRIPVKN